MMQNLSSLGSGTSRSSTPDFAIGQRNKSASTSNAASSSDTPNLLATPLRHQGCKRRAKDDPNTAQILPGRRAPKKSRKLLDNAKSDADLAMCKAQKVSHLKQARQLRASKESAARRVRSEREERNTIQDLQAQIIALQQRLAEKNAETDVEEGEAWSSTSLDESSSAVSDNDDI